MAELNNPTPVSGRSAAPAWGYFHARRMYLSAWWVKHGDYRVFKRFWDNVYILYAL